MKQLVYEAYQVPYSQIAGGPGWIDFDEFDIEGRSAGRASPAQLRGMLRTLLTDRFKLKVHTLTKGSSVYVITVGEGGSKLKVPADGLPAKESSSRFRFVCDLAEFADFVFRS